MAKTVANVVRPPVSSTEATRLPEDSEEQFLSKGVEESIEAPYISDTRINADKLNQASEKLEQIEWLAAEQWCNLTMHEKATALNQVGQVLSEIYHIPKPPLLVQTREDRYAFGSYGDGYVYNPETEQVEGADYNIFMNAQAATDYAQLFDDDPAVALETYAHEFRHAYQAEQVLRSQKPQFRNLVDDLDAATEWQHEYISPNSDYDAYHNQPVEKDARDFAEVLIKHIYG